jgi:hypothetical protein
VPQAHADLAAAAAQSTAALPLWASLGGLGGLLGLGVASVLAVRRRPVTIAPSEEFEIEE